MTGVLDIATGTLTLFDRRQIHLGAGTLRLISDPMQPLLGWELEFAGVVDPELERLGMLTHMPQAIALSDTDGRRWHGRALASTRGAVVTLLGYGPLARKPLK